MRPRANGRTRRFTQKARATALERPLPASHRVGERRDLNDGRHATSQSHRLTRDLVLTIVQALIYPDESSTYEYSSSWIAKIPEFAEQFGNQDKDGLLPIGATYHRKALANTLEIIARDGVEAFYSGTMAEEMVRVIQDRGGLMTLEDVASECSCRIGT
jgi:hypothetical protein